MVAGFRVMHGCPQVNMHSLFFRLAPPALKENLRVAELDAQKAAFALAADDVAPNVNELFHGLSSVDGE